MLSVIWMILRVILIIFAVLIALFVVLISLRTGVEAIGVTGQVSVDVRFGPLRLPIYPLRAKRKKEPPPKPETGEKPQKKRMHAAPLNWRALQWEEMIDFAMRLLGELTGSLQISHLRVRILVGTDDAAKTGIRLGQISALTSMLLPFLENTFEMKDYRVSADADFDAEQTKWAFRLFCSVRPIRLLFVFLRHGKELHRIYKQLKKKEEAIFDEPAPNQ